MAALNVAYSTSLSAYPHHSMRPGEPTAVSDVSLHISLPEDSDFEPELIDELLRKAICRDEMYRKRFKDLRELSCQELLKKHLSSLFQQCKNTWYVIDAQSFLYDSSLTATDLVLQQTPPSAVSALFQVMKGIALHHLVCTSCFSKQSINPEKLLNLPFDTIRTPWITQLNVTGYSAAEEYASFENLQMPSRKIFCDHASVDIDVIHDDTIRVTITENTHRSAIETILLGLLHVFDNVYLAREVKQIFPGCEQFKLLDGLPDTWLFLSLLNSIDTETFARKLFPEQGTSAGYSKSNMMHAYSENSHTATNLAFDSFRRRPQACLAVLSMCINPDKTCFVEYFLNFTNNSAHAFMFLLCHHKDEDGLPVSLLKRRWSDKALVSTSRCQSVT